jgi:MFS transporter, DHA2 family, multidrug resistance protein
MASSDASPLLLPPGTLGDRFGRKGVLLSGLVIFGAASVAAMLGAALLMPTTLSIMKSLRGHDVST